MPAGRGEWAPLHPRRVCRGGAAEGHLCRGQRGQRQRTAAGLPRHAASGRSDAGAFPRAQPVPGLRRGRWPHWPASDHAADGAICERTHDLRPDRSVGRGHPIFHPAAAMGPGRQVHAGLARQARKGQSARTGEGRACGQQRRRAFRTQRRVGRDRFCLGGGWSCRLALPAGPWRGMHAARAVRERRAISGGHCRRSDHGERRARAPFGGPTSGQPSPHSASSPANRASICWSCSFRALSPKPGRRRSRCSRPAPSFPPSEA